MQHVQFHIQFTFPETDDTNFFPIRYIDRFLTQLEKLDLLAGRSLGCTWLFRKTLDEFGISSFLYTISLISRPAPQGFLDPLPEFRLVVAWLEAIHHQCLHDVSPAEQAARWNQEAVRLGLTDTLMHVEMSSDALQGILPELRDTAAHSEQSFQIHFSRPFLSP